MSDSWNDDHWLDSDDPLAETARRLASAPHPQLSAAAFERIQAQVMQAVPQTAAPRWRRAAQMGGGLLIAAALLAGGVFLVIDQNDPEATPQLLPTVTETLEPTPTRDFEPQIIIPSATPTHTPTATLTNTATLPPTSSATLTDTPTMTSTGTLTPSPTHTIEPTPTSFAVLLVIEGTITELTATQIKVYDMEITITEDDQPILAGLQVGDEVRITGTLTIANELIITAVSVTVLNVEVNVNEDTNEVYRDSGDCSNPPPAWAPAVGWRKRCEGGSVVPPGQQNNPPGNSNQDDD